MKPLTFAELEDAYKNNKRVSFHPEFGYEAWKDGARGPLVLTDVSKMGTLNFIGYRCLDDKCNRCNCKDISYEICGHHQLINEAGFHIYKKVEFVETKKATLIKELDSPVFILCE